MPLTLPGECEECQSVHDLCPHCDRETDDCYGGPCSLCWAKLDDRPCDCYQRWCPECNPYDEGF